jgi:hypothetical protein
VTSPERRADTLPTAAQVSLVMTIFLHARLHRAQLRNQVTLQLAASYHPPTPRCVACPTCGDLFFADREVASGPDVRELEAWEALAKLDAECPDHPHWFTVGPYSPRS